MNDSQMRTSFHQKCLRRYHCDAATLVVDELALQHGKRRADIAVVNGHLIGYEIKSDLDSLVRLNDQISSYNAVFDRSSIIVAERHLGEVLATVPEWWGVILARRGPRGAIHFTAVRSPKQNVRVDDYAVTQLLWRDEAQEILSSLGIRGKKLREKRANLYRYIISELNSCELRRIIRDYLRNRTNWRRPASPFPGDGSSRPFAML